MANLYWDANGATAGTGGTGSWTTATSLWRSGSSTGTLTSWGAGGTHVAYFSGTAGTVSVDGSIFIGGLFSDITGYTITRTGSNVVTLNANSVANVTTGTMTISAPIAGAYTLTKQGAGTLVLTGVNTFTGNTTISVGTLQVDSDSRFGGVPASATANSVVLASGANLTLSTGFTLSTNRGIGLLSSNVTISTPSGTSSSYAGVITGAGNLVKTGSGTLTLGGINTYNTHTYLDAGTLIISNGGGSGGIRGNVTVAAGANLTLSGVDALGYNTGAKVNNITVGVGGIVNSTAAGNQGWANAYTLTGATLRSNNGTANASATSLLIFGGNTSVTTLASSTTSVIAGRILLREGNTNNSAVFDVASFSATSIDLNITGNITQSASGYGITKQGAGNLTLSAVNSYSGNTVVTAGNLSVTNASGLGTGQALVSGGFLRAFSNITNNVTLSSSGVFVANTSNILSNVIFASGSTGNITVLSGYTFLGNIVFNSGITGTADSCIRTGSISSNVFINSSLVVGGSPTTGGHIIGSHSTVPAYSDTNPNGTFSTASLIVNGPIIASGANQNFTHYNNTVLFGGGGNLTGTFISGGRTILRANNGLPTTANLQLGIGGVGNWGYLYLAGYNQTVNNLNFGVLGSGASGQVFLGTTNLSLTGNLSVSAGASPTHILTGYSAAQKGTLSLGTAVKTFDIANSGSLYDLTIANTTIVGSFNKTGTGILRIVDSTVTGNVTLTTGLLAGSFSTNAITVENGATLSPGYSNSTATLSVSTLNLNAGAVLELNVSDSASDLINVSNSLNVNGNVTISIVDFESLTAGVTYPLIQYTGTAPDMSRIQLGTLSSRVTGNLVDSGASIGFQVASVEDLVWTGNTSGTWDTSSANWKKASDGNATSFLSTDKVLFDDTGVNTTVSLSGANLVVNRLTVDSNQDYTLSTGNITGGSVVKSGSGNLTATTRLIHSGNTVVSGGALIVDQTGSTLSLSETEVVTVAGGSTLEVIANDGNLSVPRVLSGSGNLVFDAHKTGATGVRSLTLSGNNTNFSGNVILKTSTGMDTAIGSEYTNSLANTSLGSSKVFVGNNTQVNLSSGIFANNFFIEGTGASNNSAPGPYVYFPATYGGGAVNFTTTATLTGNITATAQAKISISGGAGFIRGNITSNYPLGFSSTNSNNFFLTGNLSAPVTVIGTDSALASFNYTTGLVLGQEGDALGVSTFPANVVNSGSISGDIVLSGNNVFVSSLFYSRNSQLFIRRPNYTFTNQNIIYSGVQNYTNLYIDSNVTFESSNVTLGRMRIGTQTTSIPYNYTVNFSNTVVNISEQLLNSFEVCNAANTSVTVNQTGNSDVKTSIVRIAGYATNTSQYNLYGGNLTVKNTDGTTPSSTPVVSNNDLNGGITVGSDGLGFFNQYGGNVATDFIVIDNRGQTSSGLNMASSVDQYNLYDGNLRITSLWGILSAYPSSAEFNLYGGNIYFDSAAPSNITATFNIYNSNNTLFAVNIANVTRDIRGTGTLNLTGAPLRFTANSTVAANIFGSVYKDVAGTNTLFSGNIASLYINSGTATVTGNVGYVNIASTGFLQGTGNITTLAGTGTLLVGPNTTNFLRITGDFAAYASVLPVKFLPSTPIFQFGPGASFNGSYQFTNAFSYRSGAVAYGVVDSDSGSTRTLEIAPTTATWTAFPTNSWEGSNWNIGGTAATTQNLDAVVIPDIGAYTPIALNSNVSPYSITVDSGNTVYLYGSGNVVYGTSLIKNGSGTLYIDTNLWHTGGTTLNAGVLSLSYITTGGRANVTLGTGDLTINGGSLDLNVNEDKVFTSNVIVTSNLTYLGTMNSRKLWFGVLNTTTSNTTLLSNTAVVNIAAGNMEVGGIFNTTGFTKTGAGTFYAVNALNSISGNITVNAGYFGGNANGLGNAVITVTGEGTVLLNTSQVVNNTFNISGNGVSGNNGAIRPTTSVTLSGLISLIGDASISTTGSSLFTGTINGNGYNLGLHGSSTGNITGNLVLGNSTLTTYGGTWILAGNASYGALSLQGGGLYIHNPAAFVDNISAPANSSSFGTTSNVSNLTIANPVLVNGSTLTFIPATNSTITVSGVISGLGGVNNTGAGNLVLSGNNSFIGNMDVSSTTSNGNVIVTHSNALGQPGIAKNIRVQGASNYNSHLALRGGVVIDEAISLLAVGRTYYLDSVSTSTTGYIPNLVSQSGSNSWLGNYDINSAGGTYGIEVLAGTLTLGSPNTNSKYIRNLVSSSTRYVNFFGPGNFVVNSLIADGFASSALVSIAKKGTGTLTITNNGNSFTTYPALERGTTIVSSLSDGGTAGPLGSSTEIRLGGTLRVNASSTTSTDRTFLFSGLNPTLESAGSGAVKFTRTGTNTYITWVTGTTAARLNPLSNTIQLNDVGLLNVGQTVYGTPYGSMSYGGVMSQSSDFAQDTVITGIDYDTRVVTLNKNPLANVTSSRNVYIGAPTNLNYTLTLTGTSTADNTLAWALVNPSGTGRLGLTKSGTGLWVLSGANTYTGNTTISAGTLQLGADNTIPSGSQVVLNSGLLDMNGYNDTVGGLSGTAGNLVLGSSTLQFGASNATYSGSITGNGVMRLAGVGTVTISGDNTGFSGTWESTVSGGTLIFTSPEAVGSGVVTIGGGGVLFTGTAANNPNTTVSIGSAGGSIGVTSGNVTYVEKFSGSGNLTIVNLNTVTLTNPNNDYTGGTVVSSGVLSLGASDASLGSGDIIVSGGTLDLNGFAAPANNSIQIIGGTLANGTVALDKLSNITAGGFSNLVISGSGNITKTGAGNLSLLGVNTLPELIIVSSGGLVVGSAAALDGANVSIESGASYTSSGIPTAPALAFSNTSNTVISKSIALPDAAGRYALQQVSGSGVLTLAGPITGGGADFNLVLRNSSTDADTQIYLSGAKTFVGNVVVGGGYLVVDSDSSVGGSNNSVLLETANSSLLFDSNITWTHNTALSANAYLRSNADVTMSGVLSGTGQLFKRGSGNITLTGQNTYNAATYILDGSLSVASINSVSGGTISSNLGAPNSVSAGTIRIGSSTSEGTMKYTGAGEISDRVIDLAGVTYDAHVIADGTGALVLTSSLTASGSGSKSLVLEGSSTSDNELRGAIVNNSASNKTSLVKNGSGKWVLSSNSHTFTGGVSVNGGTLKNSGTIANNAIAVTAGEFNNTGTLPATSNVSISGGVVSNEGAMYSPVTLTAGRLVNRGNTYANVAVSGGVFEVTGTVAANVTVTVSGGELKNNGTISGAVVFSSGATLSGAGTYAGTVTMAAGAELSPGNSPGVVTFANLNLATGTVLEIEADNPADSSQIDKIIVSNSLSMAGQVTLKLLSYNVATGSRGATSGFNSRVDYSWNVIEAANTTLDINNFALDTSGWVGGDGTWSLQAVGGTLTIVYTPNNPLNQVTVNSGDTEYTSNSSNISAIPLSSGVKKAGAGTLVVDSNASFTGGYAVVDGTLKLLGSGDAGSGPISFVAGTSYKIDKSTTTYINNPISGFGNFLKYNNNSVVFLGPVSFYGATIFEGFVSVPAGFTSSQLTRIFSGATLDADSADIFNFMDLIVEGSVINAPSANLATLTVGGSYTSTGGVTATGLISNSSNLTVGSISSTNDITNTGTLNVSGLASFVNMTQSVGTSSFGSLQASGAITLSGGSLLVDSSGTLTVGSNITLTGSSVAGPLNNFANTLSLDMTSYFLFNTSATITNSCTVTGNGILGMVGTGTAILSGNVTTNNIYVNSGTLKFTGNLATNFFEINNSSSVIISGKFLSSGGNFTKSGSGTLNITNSTNTYTGQMIVQEGTLKAGGTATFGASGVGNETVISSGAVLDVAGFDTGNETFIISGSGTGAGAIINSGASQFNALRNVTLAANATVGGLNRLDIRSNGGPAVLDLAGYTLTKSGSGFFGLIGTTVTPGNIVINGGNVEISQSNVVVGQGGTITLNPGANLTIGGGTTASNVSRDIVFNGGAIFTNGSPSAASSNITLNSDLLVVGTGNNLTSNLTLTGIISGNYGVVSNANSALILSGTNTFAGDITINRGVVAVTAAASVPATANIVVNGSSTDANRFSRFEVGNGVNLPNNFILNGTAAAYLGSITVPSGNVTLSGNITLNDGIFGSGGEVYGPTGSGNLTLTGNLISNRTGSSNKYFYIKGGNVILDSDSANHDYLTLKHGGGLLTYRRNNAIKPSATVRFADTASLVVDFNGFNQEFGNLGLQTYYAEFANTNATVKSVLTLSGSQNHTSNTFFRAGSAIDIIKTGSGNVTFLGNCSVSSSSLIDIQQGNFTIGNNSVTAAFSTNPTIQLAAGTSLTLYATSGSGNSFAPAVLFGAGDLNILGPANLTSSFGGITFNPANSAAFTGNVVINGARLNTTNSQVNGKKYKISNFGQLYFTSAGITSGSIEISGSGPYDGTTHGHLGALRGESASITIPVTLTGNSRITSFTSSLSLASIYGAGYTLEKAQSGTITLTSDTIEPTIKFVSSTPASNTNAGVLVLDGSTPRTWTTPITTGPGVTSATLRITNNSSVTFANVAITIGQASTDRAGVLSVSASSGVTSTLNINEGSDIEVDQFNVGDTTNAYGVVNQNGGSVAIRRGELRLGNWAPTNTSAINGIWNMSNGTLTISGAPSITAPASSSTGYLNGIYIGYDGSGQFNQNGGTVSTNYIVFDNISNTPGMDAYNLNGGTLELLSQWGVSRIGISHNFNLNGGLLRNAAPSGTLVALSTDINVLANSTFDTGLNGAKLVISGNVLGSKTITLDGAGSLMVGSNYYGTLKAPVVIGENSKLEFGRTSAYTHTGDISGAGRIIQTGVGTTTLTGNLSYTGTTTVNAGSLIVTDLSTSSQILVPSGWFRALGTVSSPVVVSGAGRVSVEGSGTLSNLTVSAGTTGGFIKTVTASNNSVPTISSLTLNGNLLVTLQPVDGVLTSGTYTLFNYTSKSGSGSITLAGSYGRNQVSLTDTGTSVQVTVVAETLIWSANATGIASSTGNWTLSSNGAIGQRITAGDNLLFNSNLTSQSLSSGSSLTTGAIVFDTIQNYFWSGTGYFINGTQLIKRGSGNLTLSSTTFNLTQGVSLREGNLLLASSTANGNTSFELGGYNANATLTSNGSNVTTTNPIIIKAGGSETITVGTVFSGYSSASIFTDIRLQRDVIANSTSNTSYAFSGNGNVTFQGAAYSLLGVVGDNNFIGDITVDSGARLQLGNVTPETNALPNISNITLNSNSTIFLATGAEGIGALSGSGNITTLNSSSNITLGLNNTNATFSGILTEASAALPLSLLKVGSGTQTLSGNSTYTGNTVVSGGTLELTGRLYNQAANTTAAIIVNLGGTLKVPTFTQAAMGNLVNTTSAITINGGTLDISGDPHFSDKSFTVGALGGTLKAPLTASAVYPYILDMGSSSSIVLNGDLTLQGRMQVDGDIIGSSNLIIDGTTFIATSAKSLSGYINVMPASSLELSTQYAPVAGGLVPNILGIVASNATVNLSGNNSVSTASFKDLYLSNSSLSITGISDVGSVNISGTFSDSGNSNSYLRLNGSFISNSDILVSLNLDTNAVDRSFVVAPNTTLNMLGRFATSGNVGFEVLGGGNVTVTAATQFVNSNNVKITDGRLIFGLTNVLGNASYTLSGGTLDLSGHYMTNYNPITFNSGNIRNIVNSQFNAVVSTGASASLSAGNIPTSIPVWVPSGSTVSLNNSPVSNTLKVTGGQLVNVANFNGTVEILSGANITMASLPGSGDIILDGGIIDCNATVSTRVIKYRSGTLVNATNYSGDLIVDGAVTIAGVNDLGSGTLVLNTNDSLDLAELAVTNPIYYKGGTLTNAHAYLGTITVAAGYSLQNGVTSARVVAEDGALIKGNGTFEEIDISEGGVLSPGFSPGKITTNTLKLLGGGVYLWQMYSTQPVLNSGPNAGSRGYDTTQVNNTLDLRAASASNRINLNLMTLANWSDNTVGTPAAENFDPSVAHTFVLFSYGVLLTTAGSTISDLFSLNTSSFRSTNGAALASGYFYIADTGSTITLNYSPSGGGIIVDSDNYHTDEDTVLTGNTLENDFSPTGQSLSVSNFTVNGVTKQAGQTHVETGKGSITLLGNGAFTFTPAANWNGTFPTVNHIVTDGTNNVQDLLTIIVDPVNDAPILVSDSFNGSEDSSLVGNVLANDYDLEGDTLSVVNFKIGNTTYSAGNTAVISNVGNLVIESTGSFTFTPVSNYNGAVPAITYTVTDGAASSNTTLNLAVAAVNDAPVAVGDTVTGTEDTVLTGNVIPNDSDIDGDQLFVTSYSIFGTVYSSGASALMGGKGTFILNSNGSYTFSPLANFNGNASPVVYTLSDGNLTSTAVLNMYLTPVNDTPTGVSDTGTGYDGNTLTGNVLANDPELDSGDTLTVSSYTVAGVVGTFTPGQTVTVSGKGSISIASNGAYTFSAAPSYVGAFPAVTYNLTDGSLSSSSTLIIAVQLADYIATINNGVTANQTERSKLNTSLWPANNILANNYRFTKRGLGTLNLTAANTHTGLNSIEAGKVVVTTSSGLGNGSVLVSNSTLQLSTSTFAIGGNLTFTGGSLILGS